MSKHNYKYEQSIRELTQLFKQEMDEGTHPDDLPITRQDVAGLMDEYREETEIRTRIVQWEFIGEHSKSDDVFPLLVKYMKAETTDDQLFAAIALAEIMAKGATEYADRWLVRDAIDREYTEMTGGDHE